MRRTCPDRALQTRPREGGRHTWSCALSGYLATTVTAVDRRAKLLDLIRMGPGKPNLDDLYVVLRGWAIAKQVKSYTDLSRDYQALTQEWFEPHGSWDGPLGSLNRALHASGAPALSALVVLKEAGEPGGEFWGCAPNVPPRPTNDVQRVATWSQIVTAVHAYPWRPSLA